MLQVLLFVISCAISFAAIIAIFHSRFRSQVADYCCAIAVIGFALLPASQFGCAKKTSVFFEQYSGILFALGALGSPILLIFAALIRGASEHQILAKKWTWISFCLSLTLIYGLYFLLILVGFGDGA